MRGKKTEAVRVVMKMNVDGKRVKGRPIKRWLDTIEGCWYCVRRGCGRSE